MPKVSPDSALAFCLAPTTKAWVSLSNENITQDLTISRLSVGFSCSCFFCAVTLWWPPTTSQCQVSSSLSSPFCKRPSASACTTSAFVLLKLTICECSSQNTCRRARGQPVWHAALLTENPAAVLI